MLSVTHKILRMYIKQLKPYQRELKEFINYMVQSKQDINKFIELDFKYQLGWYLEYLSQSNIVVLVNRLSYRIYYAKSPVVRRKSFKDKSILEIWELAIIDAFDYLEKPF